MSVTHALRLSASPPHEPRPGARRRRMWSVVLPSTALLAVTGWCAAASAATVSYENIVSPSKAISCWAVMDLKDRSRVECAAPYLPDIGDYETYLAIRARGTSIMSERSDFPGFNTPRRTLRYGDTWKRPGINCTMLATGLTCRNRDGHGFHMQRGAVRRF